MPKFTKVFFKKGIEPGCGSKMIILDQGFTKRCLSWVINSALVYEPKCGGSQPMSPAVHMELK